MDALEPLNQFLTSRPLGLERWRLRDRLDRREWWGQLSRRRRRAGLRTRRFVGRAWRGFQGFESRVDGGQMPCEHALDGLAQVLQQVPAVGDLHGLGGALRRRLGVGRRTVPADHLDLRMGLEPHRDGVCLAVGEEIDDVTTFQVHDDGAVTLPLAPRPIIDAHDPRWPSKLLLEPLDPPQQGIRAGGDRRACGEAGTGLTAQGWSDVGLGLPKPIGGPSPRCGEPWEALREDAAWAVWLWTNETTDGESEPHAPAETGQIVELAGVPAVDPAAVVTAKRARRRGGGGCQVDGEVLDVKIGTDEAAPFGSTQKLKRKQHEAPELWFEASWDGEVILLLRPRVIKSAGDPVFGMVSSTINGTVTVVQPAQVTQCRCT
jgi:hypothetical protein